MSSIYQQTPYHTDIPVPATSYAIVQRDGETEAKGIAVDVLAQESAAAIGTFRQVNAANLVGDGTLYWTQANDPSLEPGVGDFSVECDYSDIAPGAGLARWIYWSHISGNNIVRVQILATNIVRVIWTDNVGTATNHDFTFAIPTSGPVHLLVACDRSGDQVLYVNGIERGRITISSGATDFSAINIGDANAGSPIWGASVSGFYGLVAETRLFFSVPTAAQAWALFLRNVEWATPVSHFRADQIAFGQAALNVIDLSGSGFSGTPAGGLVSSDISQQNALVRANALAPSTGQHLLELNADHSLVAAIDNSGKFKYGTGRLLPWQTGAGAPTTGEFPLDKDHGIWVDTVGPDTYLAYNRVGTLYGIKLVAAPGW